MNSETRALVAGAIDLHVHSFPDLMPRSINDLTMAALVRDAGMRGFVLKSHYAPTADRAWLTQQVVPEVDVFGAVVLNHFVGGMNPLAVEALARAGGRVVYLPTSDAMNEADVLDTWDVDRPLPPYLQIKAQLVERGRLPPAIPMIDQSGAVTGQCREVLEVVADYDLVLATGHVAPHETLAVIEAAHAQGVSRILVTHPESPHIGATIEQQREMVDYGAVLERCYAYLVDEPSQQAAFEAIRATGTDNNVLSSDLGMVAREDPVTGLGDFAQKALLAGFSATEIRQMICRGPARLLDVG